MKPKWLCAALVSVLASAVPNGAWSSELELAPAKPTRTDLSDSDKMRVSRATAKPFDFSQPQPFEAKSAGASTGKADLTRNAFSGFSSNITFEQQLTFQLGNALFDKLWVSSPSSTLASDGLGPLFNARSCASCHIRDGRGHPPEANGNATSMLLRLARNAKTPEEQAAVNRGDILNFPDPIYGKQLQDMAVPGLAGEGQVSVTYSDVTVTFSDGHAAILRKPSYKITGLAYGALHADTTISPRIAQPMIGLGLIEAVHEADIAALADPKDANKDGISGRMQVVRDASGTVQLGRFGWKAQNPTLRTQSAEAFNGDIGISTPDVPLNYGDCTKPQSKCFDMANGEQARLGKSEAPDPVMELITFYSKNLAVPARRDVANADVLHGKDMFYDTGCAACHTPNFVTRRDADDPAQAFQLIWPYSDFLLHDMGEGLADGQQVGIASGTEWRTPPLWGIGLTQNVSGHTFFLHDGRARNLEEAILWHHGEAQSSRNAYMGLSEVDRDALLRFLESL
jgi:CxxC motif-containing protein (DUF1111 family)